MSVPTGTATDVAIPPPTTILQVRTGKMAKFGNITSGIFKACQAGRLLVSKQGLPEDEHDPTFHGGVDKAIHQYCADHYPAWKALYPESASRFEPGSFGENLVTKGWNEDNICAGDQIRIGYFDDRVASLAATNGRLGCLLEVSIPRQPCFKLNHRFGIKHFAPVTHKLNRTGWYLRVLEEGCIEQGMSMRIEERPNPAWPISRLHEHVHRDKDNVAAIETLRQLPRLGDECKGVFQSRWKKMQQTDKLDADTWRTFEVKAILNETSRVKKIKLQSIAPGQSVEEIGAGCHVSIKLANDLRRPYSVVGGTPDSFTLGVARDADSRGGSTYIHDKLKVGDVVEAGAIKAGISFNSMASHHIFIAGGIGITAFVSFVEQVHQINGSFDLHYCVRSADDLAFNNMFGNYRSSVHIYDSSKGQRLDIDKLMREREWNSSFYVCGPQRMIDAAKAAGEELGMPEDEVRYETFKVDASGDPFTASVESVGGTESQTVQVGAQESLLEALRKAGLDVPSSCETGNCGTCKVRLKSGRVLHSGSALTKEEKETEMLSCVSRGVAHIEISVEDV